MQQIDLITGEAKCLAEMDAAFEDTNFDLNFGNLILHISYRCTSLVTETYYLPECNGSAGMSTGYIASLICLHPHTMNFRINNPSTDISK